MFNVICAIAKNENNYINDWVNWHISLGFDKIFLYDNNSLETAYVGDFIEQKDKVEIVDVRGVHESNFQNKCYNEFYNSHIFDWCAFIDIDEYIVLNKWTNIKDFFSDPIFIGINVIRLNWHIFGDDGLIERDMSIPVYEAFKQVVPHYYNYHGKEFVRGGVPGFEVKSSHWGTINGTLPKQIMPDGKETSGKVNVGRTCNEAWINHYMTKTISEYVKQKLNRGDAQFIDRSLGMGYFWELNKKTPEKLRWLNENISN